MSYLTGTARLSSFPAAVGAAVAREGGAPAKQDVENDPEAPQVTALIIERSLIHEDFNHLGSHVLRRATLQQNTPLTKCLCTLKYYLAQFRIKHFDSKVVFTGVVSSGVVIGVQALFNLTPLPRSKSQIFTGDT